MRSAEHLRRLAREGALGPKIVAIGPWWTRDGNNQIDAVVMAEYDKKRVPVLVGECKWGKRVDASRIKATLIRKAASPAPQSEDLRYFVCARDEIVNADDDTLTTTAADIFGRLKRRRSPSNWLLLSPVANGDGRHCQ